MIRAITSLVASSDPSWNVPINLSKKLNLDPSKILFVGDTFEADVIGSKSVGMRSVWLNKGKEASSEKKVIPDFEIKDVTEVIDLINI